MTQLMQRLAKTTMIYRSDPYPAYKPSGVAWLGDDVPAHWKILPNRAIFAEVNEQNCPGEQMLSVTITNGVIRQRELLKDTSRKDSSRLDKAAYKLVQPGDIAYNKMRAWQGAIGSSKYRGVVSPAYVVQRPLKGINSHYLHYLLRTPGFAKEAERWSYGITSDMWSLRPEHFKMIYTCAPPLPEQTRIVRFLDHADQRIRRYVHAKQKLIALLEEQKQAIVHQAVTGQVDVRTGQPYPVYKPSGAEWLADIPEHWEVRRLKWVTRLQRGYDLPADQRVSGPYPVVSSGGIIGTHSESRCTGPGVVMGRYGSTDAIFFVEQDFWPHNTSLFVTHFHGNDPKWCYLLLASISKADHARKSAVPGVDRKDLFQILVPVPPVQVQFDMVTAIEETLRILDKATDETLRKIDLLHEYRARLIADVVTGKLDVRETAAALPDTDSLAAEDDLDETFAADDSEFDNENEPVEAAD